MIHCFLSRMFIMLERKTAEVPLLTIDNGPQNEEKSGWSSSWFRKFIHEWINFRKFLSIKKQTCLSICDSLFYSFTFAHPFCSISVLAWIWIKVFFSLTYRHSSSCDILIIHYYCIDARYLFHEFTILGKSSYWEATPSYFYLSYRFLLSSVLNWSRFAMFSLRTWSWIRELSLFLKNKHFSGKPQFFWLQHV